MKRFPDMVRRPDSLDDYIIQEVSCYEHLAIKPGEVVLDVGGNIGSFTRLAAEAGAARIIAIEPDPSNIEIFKQNMALISGPEIKLIEGAVTSDKAALEKGTMNLYLNVKKNKGLHSVVETRGREAIEVSAISWEGIINAYNPHVIKVDIEGGEYFLNWEMLDRALTPNLRALAVELHLSKKGWRTGEQQRVLFSIAAAGFKNVFQMPDTSGKRWTSFYVFQR